MKIETPRLGLGKAHWDSIEGSNVHAAMVLNRVHCSDCKNDKPRHPEEWLEAHCTKAFFWDWNAKVAYFLSRGDRALFIMTFS